LSKRKKTIQLKMGNNTEKNGIKKIGDSKNMGQTGRGAKRGKGEDKTWNCIGKRKKGQEDLTW